MSVTGEFRGFSSDAILFFKRLKRNNKREWFEKRKAFYEAEVLLPSYQFVEAIRPQLKKLSPHLVIIPKRNKSVGRIYRDVRFKEDKSPYKTSASFLFWDARRDKGQSPACYISFSPEELILGCGLWHFETQAREHFRQWVMEPKQGAAFYKIIKKIRAQKKFEVGGRSLKRFPGGYDLKNVNAEFLLHNGIFLSRHTRLPKSIHTKKIVGECAAYFLSIKPFFDWVTQLTLAIPENKWSGDGLF